MTSATALSAESITRIEAVLDAVPTADAPGLAAIVVLDGRVVFRGARGLANLEYAVPITPSTPFHIASMSKQFAGFALALVAVRGLLDLDADLRSYLPYVPALGGATITSRQLAHHTSGLRDQWGELVLSGWRIDDVITTQDCLGLIKRMESLNFEPGTGFSYSNTGYTLMSELILTTTGKTLREFCAEEIFEPLGMGDTHFHDRHDELVPGRAYSYMPDREGGFRHAHLMYAVVGSTSLHTTAEDMVRWDQNFYDRKVGSDRVFELMRESGVLADGTTTGYAFGLFHDRYRGQRREHHSGGDAGFGAQGERYPELGLSVYVVRNVSTVDPQAVATALTDVVMDELGIAPIQAESIGTVEDPDRLAGSYINRHTGFAIELTATEAGLTFMGLPLRQSAPHVLKLRSSITLQFAENDGPPESVALSMMAVQPQLLERYVPVTPTASELGEYAGQYWSEELATFYELVVEDGVLVALQREHGRVPLTPTATDSFSAMMTGLIPMQFAVTFDRDSTGTVDGLRLTMARTDNIVAKRVPA